MIAMNENEEKSESVNNGGMTRDRFLELIPELEPWVEDMEGTFGVMRAAGQLSLNDGRKLLCARFENVWHFTFINPANNAELGQDRIQVNLSPEMFCLMRSLSGYLCTEAEEDADYQKLMTFAPGDQEPSLGVPPAKT